MVADSPAAPPAQEALPPEDSRTGAVPKAVPRWALGILALAMVFNLSIHLRLLSFPLERDEGEFAYTAVRLLHGDLPYATAYNKKLPGVSYMYALAMLVHGETATAVKLAGTAADLVSILFLFCFAVRLQGPIAGAAAAMVYAVMSVDVAVLGNASHATHFVNAFCLPGLWVLLTAVHKRRPILFVASGLLFGLALLMKQHAAGIGGLLAVWLLIADRRNRRGWRDSLLFAGALVLPAFVLLIVTAIAGLLPTLWLWTVRYAAGYGSDLSLPGQVQLFAHRLGYIVNGYVVLWVVSALGLFLWLRDGQAPRQRRILVALYLVGAVLSLLPGGLFREHYFVTVLPLVGVGVGLAGEWLFRFLRGRWNLAAFGPALLIGLAALLAACMQPSWRYFFVADPVQLSREIYRNDDFAASPELGRFIMSRTTSDDTIAVMGSEAQIYFYSHRKAATGFIYVYGLMDGHAYGPQMQRQMIREIEANRPKIVVVVNIPNSWLPVEHADSTIIDWTHRYMNERYRLIGLTDIYGDAEVTKRFQEIQGYQPSANGNIVYVFERTGPT